jgi:MoaA/NifB/PqqE/SkfB family radical SAM enzyme
MGPAGPIILSMITLSSQDLGSYLEKHYDFHLIDIIDLDWLKGQSRRTLYQRFKSAHRDVFANNERVMLYSRKVVPEDLLRHIQICGSKIDISNAFILICAPALDLDLLEKVRQENSTDLCVFDTLQINLSDPAPEVESNPWLNLPESFCFSPWAHLEVSSRGEFKPCCVYRSSIKDGTGRPYNISQDSIESVYQSQQLIDLRKQFLSGQRPEGCSHCWQSETAIGYSNRNWLASHLSNEIDRLEVEQTSDISNLISLDIKLGNTCNFKCRICGPESSSRIAEERWSNGDRTFDLKQLNSFGRWTENDNTWHTLNHLGSQLVNIDFYGGEPFLIKQHEKFLDQLVQQGYAGNIKLHYNSNGSVYPSNLFYKWQEFKAVNISFSIDDTGSRFELQRGGNWLEVERNLKDFLSNRLPNMSLGIFPTINAQNIYYLPQLIEWFENTGFDSLVFNILEFPDFLSIKNMGDKLTTAILDRLSSIPTEQKEKYQITQLLNFLKQPKKLGNRVEELRKYVLNLDKIRNQTFAHSHPEVAKLIYIGT